MRIVGVIGGAKISKEVYTLARRMGNLIGEREYALITGGLGGVMEAASRGAKEKGGLVIGILPGNSRNSANKWVDIPIVTGMNHARNVIIAQSADILIAIKCKIPLSFEKVDSPEEAIKEVDTFFSK
jgi:uncharacterized protein (TIGR00725 family)